MATLPPRIFEYLTRRFRAPQPARAALADLARDDAEVARWTVKLGIVAIFEAIGYGTPPEGFDRAHHEGLYLRLADRIGESAEALRTLDDREAETFRSIFLEVAPDLEASGRKILRNFRRDSERGAAAIRPP